MGYSGGGAVRKSVPDDVTESGAFLFCAGKMLVLVPVRAEVVMAPALGQAWEAPGQVQVWGWAKRLARQQLVQVLVTSPVPITASPWFPYHHQSDTCRWDCR